ncbi:SurA N-terminal domain-containing protein [Planococcus sp. S3-L1]|uniref:SurA N-terminal domain-containing protein n=1 Tax=Planococcus sp. S3-L1 TaxID=3046200 RepID=UPI0024BAA892|nr:SurA N-terminal domain-containing protein [Planococcus sp. S3-L1]MDJ0331318.1 SurA N-terminal domain-containing protein [Planococcus sp. S3-L1]
MMKKMKFAFAPILLLLTLGACSDQEETKSEENTAPETTEETAGENTPTESALELPEQKDVVVVVNEEEILGKVYNSVARQLESSLTAQGQDVSEDENAALVKEQALSVLIGNKVILQDAAKKGYQADEKIVEERLEELKSQFESTEVMDKALKETGFTLADMEVQLREQSIYEQYVAEEVTAGEVTDEEVKTAYDGFAETSEEEAPAFEEMEPTIRTSLEEQQTQEAVVVQIEELKKTAEIEVNI